MGRNNGDFKEGKEIKTKNDKIAEDWGYEGGDQNDWD
jgi:hypothetical protein